MIILLNILAAQNVWAIDFLMNSEGQAAGGLGIVTTTGASSLSYNPAALGNAKKTEAAVETGYLNVKYTYTFPEYDPVEVKVSSPYLNSGISIPLNNNFTIGGSLFPIPGGGPALVVKKIPSRQLSQEPGLIDVMTRNTSALDYTIASGLSFTNRSWFSIGISYIRSKAENETIVSDSESESEIFTLETKSLSETGLFGLKIKATENINLGLTYQSKTKTAVSGCRPTIRILRW
jgi:long-subunit fatty acid transport protein